MILQSRSSTYEDFIIESILKRREVEENTFLKS